MSASGLRVALVGLGPVGRSIARVTRERPGVEIVGGADLDAALDGQDLGELAGGSPLGVAVERDLAALVARVRPDVVLQSTASRFPDALGPIRAALEGGCSVVSTCEELAYPFHRYPDLAAEVDALARERGAVLIGAGINPGFVMDKLVVTLLAGCTEVRRVRARRVVDAALRREPLRRKVGAGLSPAEFEDGRRAGRIGHVGLAESAHLIAEAIGVPRDRDVAETLEPAIAASVRESGSVRVEAGRVAGIRQSAVVTSGGQERVRLELEMSVGAENPEDSIAVDGSPPLALTIAGGIHGDEGTAAVIVNAACLLSGLAPGLRTVLDLPLRFAASP